MRYISRPLCAAMAAAMLVLCCGCNTAVTDNTANNEANLVSVPERTMAVETVQPTAEPTATAEPTPTVEPTPEPTPEDDGLPYYLYVEKGSFTLTIYEKDENGEYTKVYKTYRIAHGGNKTPAGIYTLGGDEVRERWHDFPDGGTVQYATRYEGRLYIHSPLYATSDPTQMWPKYYNGDHGIGLESTGGCLRMVTEASKFIYENCPEGTTLEIVNGSPRGTTSEDIPSRNGLRIDPTDYDTLRANGYIE